MTLRLGLPLQLGQVVATPAAIMAIGPAIDDSINRHQSGDWGEAGYVDCYANNQSLITGGRIHSVYMDSAGITFWIITEADRSLTTVLLPEDY